MIRNPRLLAAIKVLLKARARPAVGQQIGLFGGPGPTQTVHVAQHLRETAHGSQVVRAHDEHRRAADPAPPAAPVSPAGPKQGSVNFGYEDRRSIPAVGSVMKRPDGSYSVVTSVGKPERVSEGLSFGYRFDEGWSVDLVLRRATPEEAAPHVAAADASRRAAEAATQARAAIRGKLEELRSAGWRSVILDKQPVTDRATFATEGDGYGAITIETATLNGQPVYVVKHRDGGGTMLWLQPGSPEEQAERRKREAILLESVRRHGYDPTAERRDGGELRAIMEDPFATQETLDARAAGLARMAEKKAMLARARAAVAAGVLSKRDIEDFHAYYVGRWNETGFELNNDNAQPAWFMSAIREPARDRDMLIEQRIDKLARSFEHASHRWETLDQIQAEARQRGTTSMVADQIAALRVKLLGPVIDPKTARATVEKSQVWAYDLAQLQRFAAEGAMDKLPKKIQAQIQEQVAASLG